MVVEGSAPRGQARGLECVVQEHGDGHRANPAGDRGEAAGHLGHALSIAVPDQPPLAAGLVTVYGGVLRADLSSTWDYCGAGKTIVTVPCRCPERDIQTTWPGEAIVCFSRAPDSAYFDGRPGV